MSTSNNHPGKTEPQHAGPVGYGSLDGGGEGEGTNEDGSGSGTGGTGGTGGAGLGAGLGATAVGALSTLGSGIGGMAVRAKGLGYNLVKEANRLTRNMLPATL